MIAKIVKREDPYARISNSVLNDNRISYKARGILCHLISKPNNWEVKIEELYNNSVEGVSSIRSGIEELVLTGYMEMKNEFDFSKGVFSGRYYKVYEQPLISEGYRMIENKNKSFKPDEIILSESPLGDRKKMKSKQ